MGDIKCLGLSCSPRATGNTTVLLERALAGASSAGAATELVRLADYSVSPCRACDGCFNNGLCVIKDGAGDIFDKIIKADRIILAAPIFSMGMNAQAKSLVDRSQRFWASRYILGQPVIKDPHLRPARGGIYISAAGTDLKGVFDGAIRVARYFFKMLDIGWNGSFCYPLTDKIGDIYNNPAALEEVYRAGKRLARAGNDPS
ncbi:iron-sulfur flavoprotein [Desulfocucumis palustris]|uniref:Iron-sulfur flavoprotein n=1 Tax=Desulfocucumis palustris TaxID=1898651 RepID=A0A2L2XJV8_9FIRM|nr:flavodoxin family protein [Desulfocucumis palustris]GBF34556.1 iron-sulfur flavoprotein [Desulfocucumis palustris]